MDHKRFHSLARETHGFYGYQRKLARRYKVQQTIVRRWCIGKIPIPDNVVADLRADAATKLGAIGELLA